MAILKRAKLSGKVVMSETILECQKCWHKDVGRPRKCPKCGEKMTIVGGTEQ
jgi:Zn finger protein HypA/HybF involved in hydrogenase expression